MISGDEDDDIFEQEQDEDNPNPSKPTNTDTKADPANPPNNLTHIPAQDGEIPIVLEPQKPLTPWQIKSKLRAWFNSLKEAL